MTRGSVAARTLVVACALLLMGSSGAAQTPFTLRLDAATTVEFVWVAAGTFEMGSATGDPDERPVHGVTISQGFQLGKYEVTQAQWVAVMGKNPAAFTACGGSCPVENVSWEDVQHFLAKLNARKDGYRYRLPTEAEWEYSARAGTTGDYAGPLDEMGWYEGNAGGTTHPVGQKRANAWGLFDMHGNVWEWVSDRFGPYAADPVTDPIGASSGEGRVVRSGAWNYTPRYCRSAYRSWYRPRYRYCGLGFRLVRVQSGGPGVVGAPAFVAAALGSAAVIAAVPDSTRHYLLYLHPRIVEEQGPKAVSAQFGPYEYDAILRALGARGFTVISDVRPKDTGVVGYADQMVVVIRRLLDGGVPPRQITVVGASKGGLIGLYLSSLLGPSDVNFVLMGICPAAIEPLRAQPVVLRGRVLTIRDVNDTEDACSAEPLAQASLGKGLSVFKEIVLQVGTGPGVLFRPMVEWINPVVEWSGLSTSPVDPRR